MSKTPQLLLDNPNDHIRSELKLSSVNAGLILLNVVGSSKVERLVREDGCRGREMERGASNRSEGDSGEHCTGLASRAPFCFMRTSCLRGSADLCGLT